MIVGLSYFAVVLTVVRLLFCCCSSYAYIYYVLSLRMLIIARVFADVSW